MANKAMVRLQYADGSAIVCDLSGINDLASYTTVDAMAKVLRDAGIDYDLDYTNYDSEVY